MTDDPTPTVATPITDVARRLEAILLIVDEPQSLVALAAAVGAPVAAVRQAVAGLVADYDGEAGGPRRGFELREVGGGWRMYVRAEHDALLRYPMIPSDRIAETHLRLFIPHQPQRDNALARRLCPMLTDGRNTAEGAAATRNAIDCMAAMWTVSIDGTAIPLADFVPLERRDLGMRGLVGYIPLGDRQPGRHTLELVWNADGGDTGKQRRREYRIPFWFIPQIAERVQRD